MIEFQYAAKNKDGELLGGSIEADNASAAAKILISKDIFPITIEEKEKSSFSIPFLDKIKLKDKSFLARQLATAVNAGLPISQALQMISGQITHKKLKNILLQVTRDVEGGTQLSVAFSKFPELFGPIEITLITAGETSGTLDKILIRIADTVENEFNLQKKIQSAMVYPAFILFVVIGVIVMMSIYVMPQMEGLYASFNAQLPLMTRVVLAFSHFIAKGGVYILLLMVATAYILRVILKTDQGRRNWDYIKIKIPLIGPFLRKVYIARFARTLTGLIGSGVSLVESLNIVSKAVGNKIYEEKLIDAAEKVKSGIPLSTPLKDPESGFPGIVSQLVKVGEQTGELDNMLSKVAEYFESEVESFVKNLSSIIEPVLIVVMAVLVGVIMIAIMLPIYRIGKIL